MKRLTVLLLVCALAAFGLAACGSSNNDNNTTSATTGTTGASGASGASGTTGASSGGGGGTLNVSADPSGALKFTKDTLSTSAGKVKVDFENKSSVPHDVTIEKGSSKVGGTKVVTNGSANTTVTLKAGKYTFFCSVDGHQQAGMKGTLTVK